MVTTFLLNSNKVKTKQVFCSHPGRIHLCGRARLSLIHTRPALRQSAPLFSPTGQKQQEIKSKDSRE